MEIVVTYQLRNAAPGEQQKTFTDVKECVEWHDKQFNDFAYVRFKVDGQPYTYDRLTYDFVDELMPREMQDQYAEDFIGWLKDRFPEPAR